MMGNPIILLKRLQVNLEFDSTVTNYVILEL